jgi:hypothetical protein
MSHDPLNKQNPGILVRSPDQIPNADPLYDNDFGKRYNRF